MNTDTCLLPTAERPLRLAVGEGLAEQVRDLAARESSCCSFFTFDIVGTDQALTLDISVPPSRQDILNALNERARELSA